MFKKYIEYIKDNPEGYWFKRKLYGWGWTPAKWQGWLTILGFVVFIILVSFTLSANPTNLELYWFFGEVGVGIIFLLSICYKKGEKPKWQWGNPKK